MSICSCREGCLATQCHSCRPFAAFPFLQVNRAVRHTPKGTPFLSQVMPTERFVLPCSFPRKETSKLPRCRTRGNTPPPSKSFFQNHLPTFIQRYCWALPLSLTKGGSGVPYRSPLPVGSGGDRATRLDVRLCFLSACSRISLYKTAP